MHRKLSNMIFTAFGHQRVLAAAAVGILAMAPGCSEDDAATKPDEKATAANVEKSSGAVLLADDSFDADKYERRELDLNNDGKPDAYQFLFRDGEDVVVVRKEVDVNFDGKIDLIRTMNERGDLVQERMDYDFDGRVDVINIFEKGVIVQKQYDFNFDQKADTWRFFENGVIARKEADLDFNGNVDYWEYYEAGKIDRIGVDRNDDGVVDDWKNATEG